MVLGTGIDIVKVDRIRQSVERTGERFLERVFTHDELAYCNQRKDPYPSLAVRFAAKEACVKAINTEGFVAIADVEVVNASNGKPSLNVQGKLEDAFREMGVKKAHLSLSHEKDYAVAIVVLEG